MTDLSTPAPLAAALPHASEFVLEVLHAASQAPYGTLAWPDINRLAARWLRPDLSDRQSTDTSRRGHAVVLAMVEQGLLDAEVTTTGDGTPMVERVLHPRIFGVHFGRDLAA
ncbi:MAG TPA: hypothetical protein VD962_09070 [Rubricoccaceae bacterium]|nr:hypothetical protein [Rubricoccaceae bacterium]